MSHADGEWTIVLFATRGLAAFVENALIGIERCGINGSLVQLVFPADAECELGQLAKTFGARRRILEQLVEVKAGDMPAAYVEWNTHEFNVLLKYRFPALRAILAEGNRIVYADLDVAWLHNPLFYLANVLDHYSWTCQTEPSGDFTPNFCLGFFALSGTSESLQMIDHHIALNEGDALNQFLFREILVENPWYLVNIYPLPEGLFPSGLLYRCVGTGEEPPVPLVDRLRPFIFHGNWCVGPSADCSPVPVPGSYLTTLLMLLEPSSRSEAKRHPGRDFHRPVPAFCFAQCGLRCLSAR